MSNEISSHFLRKQAQTNDVHKPEKGLRSPNSNSERTMTVRGAVAKLARACSIDAKQCASNRPDERNETIEHHKNTIRRNK
jgi:hypothetical protein